MGLIFREKVIVNRNFRFIVILANLFGTSEDKEKAKNYKAEDSYIAVNVQIHNIVELYRND